MIIKIRVRNQGATDTSESTINVGTAKHLYGKVHVLSIFVSNTTNLWARNDISNTLEKLLESQRWLKIQAARYGKTVHFVNTIFGEDFPICDDTLPKSCDCENAYYYACSLIQRIGFGDNESYIRWVQEHTDCDQCLVIIFCNKDGRSFASPISKELQINNPTRYNLECCFLYRYYTDSITETTSASIAHEILHLFGAWDLYELDSNDTPRFEKCNQMFPDSIMIETYRSIWDTKIDEINAWLVGLNKKKEWYRWFEPEQEEYLSE